MVYGTCQFSFLLCPVKYFVFMFHSHCSALFFPRKTNNPLTFFIYFYLNKNKKEKKIIKKYRSFRPLTFQHAKRLNFNKGISDIDLDLHQRKNYYYYHFDRYDRILSYNVNFLIIYSIIKLRLDVTKRMSRLKRVMGQSRSFLNGSIRSRVRLRVG